MDASGLIIAPTSNSGISLTAFNVLNWFFFGLCNLAFVARLSIRYTCFRKFLIEDYLMLVAMLIHGAESILIQVYVRYAYLLEALERGQVSPLQPNLFSDIRKGLLGFGLSYPLTTIGVFIVKLNFLFFIRRLSTNIRTYTVFWWIVLVFNVGVTGTLIGLQDFSCFFGSTEYIFGPSCTNTSALRRVQIHSIISSALDALSEVLIFILPVSILWKSHITLRQKFGLTVLFGLVFFTIAVTIVRGSIFTDVYSIIGTKEAQEEQVSFAWFWFYIEFSVAILVGCILSFRSLFVYREKKMRDRMREQQKHAEAQRLRVPGWRLRARRFQDSLVTTCKSLEGWSDSEASTLTMFGLPKPASGLMTVDFEDDTNWAAGTTEPEAHILVQRSVSVQSLVRRPEEVHAP